jgi:hypothetical protein
MLTRSHRNFSKLSLDNLRPLLVAAILCSGSWLGISPLLAASAPPGTITNQATGSFVDELDPNNTPVLIQSNTVRSGGDYRHFRRNQWVYGYRWDGLF